jgi:glycosyltransferase involved in cell wall biosynthesis
MFASEYESWSIPIMEAMACGCPVASSNVTSLPEQVKNAGLLFDPHDIAAMAGIMELLASDEPLRKSLSQKGIERVREFSPRNFVQAIGRAYEFACSAYRSRKAA